jgi:glycosyltransferase involved in cell wall biosynthesis
MARKNDNDSSIDRPMRIAVVGGRGIPSNYSGVETIVENLFEHFARKGHLVTVYCRPGVLDEPQAMYRGMRLVRTAAPGGKLETPAHTALSCLHAVRRGDVFDDGARFDLFSFHAIPPNIAQKIPAMARIPTISHVHGLDHQREKWKGMGARIIRQAEREMVKHAAQIVTVNRSIVDYYKTSFGVDAALLPNGIHPCPESFTPDQPTLDRFRIRPGEFMVTISRLVPEKRHNDVIAAFRKLRTNHKLVIVGEGSNSDGYVQDIQKQAGDDGRIIFAGLQKGDALQTLFRSAALYLTASELEGLPSSLLECMDRNVCAVVSDIPPHAELMERVEGYDLMFRVGDVDGMARSIQKCLDTPAHAATLAIRARDMVREHYLWPVLAEKTEQLYREVLSRSRRV